MKLYQLTTILTLLGISIMLALASQNNTIPTWLSCTAIIAWGSASILAIIKAKKEEE